MATDDKKVAETMAKALKVLDKAKLSIPEILVFYGNLGYHLGASIAGLKGTGPNLEEIKQEYYRNPSVDLGLMMQGLLITTWEEDFIQHPKLSRYHTAVPENKKGK